jgi:hypothetical protein
MTQQKKRGKGDEACAVYSCQKGVLVANDTAKEKRKGRESMTEKGVRSRRRDV